MSCFSIVLEGVDGAGKTIQALKLSEYFGNLGEKVFYLKSPQGSEMAESIFSNLLGINDPSAAEELVSFLARDAVFYQEIVLPKLAQDAVLVFDRWEGSFLNYLHNVRNFSSDFLEAIWSYAADDFKPNLVLLLDVSLEESLSRIKKKKILSKFDIVSPELLELQRNGFRDLAERFGWKVINGDKSVLEVHKDICSIVNERRGEWN